MSFPQQPPGGFGGGYPPSFPPGGGYGQPPGYPPAQPGPGYPGGGGAQAPYAAPAAGHWADHIQQAQIGGGGPPRVPFGDYLVQVLDVKEHRGFKGLFFLVNFRVVQSSNPQCPVGTEGSDQVRLDSQFPLMSLGDVAAFCAAALGIHPNDPRVKAEITREVIMGMTSVKPCPVAGHILGLNCYPHTKRNAAPGTPPFPRYRWSPMLENGRPMRRDVQAAPPPAQAPQGVPMGQPPSAQPGQAPWGGPPAAPGPQGPYGYPPGQVPQTPPQAYGPPPGQPPAAPQWGPPQAAPAYQPPPFQAPQVPQAAPAFPPPGWQQHPQSAAHWYNPNLGAQGPVLTEQELRSAQAAGRA